MSAAGPRSGSEGQAGSCSVPAARHPQGGSRSQKARWAWLPAPRRRGAGRPGGSSCPCVPPAPPTHLLLLLLYECLLVLPGGQEHVSVLLADYVAISSAGSAHMVLEPAPALASLLPAVGDSRPPLSTRALKDFLAGGPPSWLGLLADTTCAEGGAVDPTLLHRGSGQRPPARKHADAARSP